MFEELVYKCGVENKYTLEKILKIKEELLWRTKKVKNTFFDKLPGLSKSQDHLSLYGKIF